MVVTDHLEVLQAVIQDRIPVQRHMQVPGRILERVGQGLGQVVPQTCHRGQCLRHTRVVRLHNKQLHLSEEADHHLEDQADLPNEEGEFKNCIHVNLNYDFLATQPQKYCSFSISSRRTKCTTLFISIFADRFDGPRGGGRPPPTSSYQQPPHSAPPANGYGPPS